MPYGMAPGTKIDVLWKDQIEERNNLQAKCKHIDRPMVFHVREGPRDQPTFRRYLHAASQIEGIEVATQMQKSTHTHSIFHRLE